MKTALGIAIDARISPASAGGVAQVSLALIRALGQLDGPESYKIIVDPGEQADYFRPYLGSNQRLELWPRTFRQRVKSAVARGTRLIAKTAVDNGTTGKATVPSSNGFYEALNCQVIHFPHQNFVLCDMPTVYNPHDLQHVHFPQFFTTSDVERKDMIYRAGCNHSRTVVAASQWVKDDIIESYGIKADKVQ